MSASLPKSVQKVIEEFEKLPGVGPKSAARMAYHYLRSSNRDASKLADSLTEMEEKVMNCALCFNISESEVCSVCSNKLREKFRLCVVEEPLDVVAFDRSGVYNGMYFVLGGVISPADGIGAEELRFPQLKKRVENLIEEIESETKSDKKLEVIVATNPSLEGEATATYIQDLLNKYIKDGNIRLSRLAMGLPTGADLEYADPLTLKRALEGRQEI